MVEYIDKTIVEGNVLNELAELLKSYGWTHERYFKKTVFPSSFINPLSPIMPNSKITFGIAEHIILKHPNPDVNVFYGFALYGEFSHYYGMLPNHLKPMTNVTPPIKEESATIYTSPDGFKDLAVWATNRYPSSRQNHTIYMYMCSLITDDIPENGDICIAFNGDLKRAALDIEVLNTAYYMLAGSPIFQVNKAIDSCMQSPITQMSMRVPSADISDPTLSSLTPYKSSNWHNDSLIRLRGITNGLDDDNYLFLIVEADSAGAYEDNVTPSIPLFLGKFIPEDPEDKWNFALSAGSSAPTLDPKFDHDDPELTKKHLHPLLKTYTLRPSNGIDSIMVYRNKYGAFYQQHIITASAPSNVMPPILTHEGRDYPRAWQRPDSMVNNYQYNPGRYTNEVSASAAHITHPDEGIRGTFPNLIVTLPLRLNTGDRLKVRIDTCEDVYDYYRYFLPEAISPFSKIPGVPYRQMGIGLKYKKGELNPQQ